MLHPSGVGPKSEHTYTHEDNPLTLERRSMHPQGENPYKWKKSSHMRRKMTYPRSKLGEEPFSTGYISFVEMFKNSFDYLSNFSSGFKETFAMQLF